MAHFSFAMDGKVDMMSLNPLEMTNFEMAGAVFGVVGILIAFVLSRRGGPRQKPHEFSVSVTDEGAIE
jgi:hypothetical protein